VEASVAAAPGIPTVKAVAEEATPAAQPVAITTAGKEPVAGHLIVELIN
jgi:DNA polymerase IIIc chi subunit